MVVLLASNTIILPIYCPSRLPRKYFLSETRVNLLQIVLQLEELQLQVLFFFCSCWHVRRLNLHRERDFNLSSVCNPLTCTCLYRKQTFHRVDLLLTLLGQLTRLCSLVNYCNQISFSIKNKKIKFTSPSLRIKYPVPGGHRILSFASFFASHAQNPESLKPTLRSSNACPFFKSFFSSSFSLTKATNGWRL